MQKDFHYFGTYLLARAAGVKQDTAHIIATASQYVDEAVKKASAYYVNGNKIERIATAHHMRDLKNLDTDDQRLVWVPFHFLPGGLGKSFTEKLICVRGGDKREDNIADILVENALNQSERVYRRELIGITAHVYADTFAHYGFSGISSKFNKVDNKAIMFEVKNPDFRKYMLEKARIIYEAEDDKPARLLDKSEGFGKIVFNEGVELVSRALGHGAVAGYPDKPFLKWNFRYDERDREPELLLPEFEKRDNTKNFLKASEKLFEMFQRYLAKAPEDKDSEINIAFDSIKDGVKAVLSFQGKKEARIEKWEAFFKEREFEEGEIPAPLDWDKDLKSVDEKRGAQRGYMAVDRFFEAAKYHREYVLDTLLSDI